VSVGRGKKALFLAEPPKRFQKPNNPPQPVSFFEKKNSF
jgi:hypothetical protein